ncbi:iron chelate uptake ABC transporter family permease subunit [Nocardiopsis sp. N85]|uniref:iron chelate uptake ABC transporter family permease subunit n=1 Tax=Nocardiopsis sp. N85 TaxID=3029400 RepID=UPI00237F3090|nr:iron chelate uptake ABC transporter family permease subunit [Nocardiopsis sp. N85]MDE3721824.1 iron chelate uptake ABC transporter family permease subunit [Nocardiopsis sp. N85]
MHRSLTALDRAGGRGAPGTPGARPPASGGRSVRRRLLWSALCVALLALSCAASLLLGSARLPMSTVWTALTSPEQGIDHLTVLSLRVPRTILGVLVGAALGAAGALAQALTRNPLADPGILGVNAGAALAIAVGVAALGVTRLHQYLWLGFAGALGATALVYLIAARGPGGATPLRLTLVGVALGAVFTGAASTLSLMDPMAFDRMRHWGAGTLADRPEDTAATIAPFVLAGLVAALALARPLNALALGDELARAVGARVALTRGCGVVVIAVLCGAATAAAGPIGFVGLMVPHAVRLLTGPDQRWILPFTLVLAPVLLLVSDVIGRLVVWPAELQVGVITALLGAPVLILLVRRAKAGAP